MVLSFLFAELRIYDDNDVLLSAQSSDDFRIKNGNSLNKDDEGATKQQMVGNMTWWYNNNSYLKFTKDGGAYPDAIEYKRDNQAIDRLYYKRLV